MWSRQTWKTVVVPGGILLGAAAIIAQAGWLTLPLPALNFLYYCAVLGGMLLAWRFHSSRTFFALLALFLAGQVIGIFGTGAISAGSPGARALQAVSLLVPLNFVLIALMHERGFTLSNTAPLGLVLFVEIVIVSVVSRTAETLPGPVHSHHIPPTVSLPEYAALAFVAAGVFLLARSVLSRKPADAAFLWALLSFFLSLRFLGNPRVSASYAAVAACILAISIIENSYLLAYHDELTTLPSRRAFNDALLRLRPPYAIAVVDIDHFKRFNDTYGHDTGDQVLRLVASNLARVTGGGQAYRCGGEEFNILFPSKTLSDVLDHLERLRANIETSEFRMRSEDRRQVPRGPDRRNDRKKGRPRRGDAIRQLAHDQPSSSLSVTVSIGVAESREDSYPDIVLEAADKALYRAKESGRNRVESDSPKRRNRTKAAGIA